MSQTRTGAQAFAAPLVSYRPLGVGSALRSCCTILRMLATWGLMYVIGVVIGLCRVDGNGATKVIVALLWPLGPLAFVATLAILLVASVIAFPVVGAAAAAAAAGAWWLAG